MDERITKEQFHNLTRSLIGLPVSKTWRGVGSAIFFELGKLTEEQRQHKDGTTRISHRGEAGVMLEWSWRVERPKSVLFGSWSGDKEITNKLLKLQHLVVVDITVEGRLPELVIQLSDGHWIHSFTTVDGQPQWCLFLSRDKSSRQWVTSEIGKLVLSTEEAKS